MLRSAAIAMGLSLAHPFLREVARVEAARVGAPTMVCPTFVAIRQWPSNPYYQTTATITVEWGEESPDNYIGGCDAWGPPSGFAFTVNGVDRTSYFTVNGLTATGNVPLVNGTTNTLRATAQGHDSDGNPTTNADVRTTYVNASVTAVAPVVTVDSLNPGPLIERDLCVTVALGSAAAYECGDLRLAHALPSVRTLNRERMPTLLYNSQHAHPWPLVAANVTLPAGAAVPDSVVGIIRFGVVVRGRGAWPGNSWAAGQTRRVVVGYDGISDTNGVYTYSLEVTNFYGTTPAIAPPASGQFIVVNRASSPFGAGWWLAGLEQLNPATMLWVGGDGSARVYQPAGTNVWAAPNLDRPDTLKWVPPYYVRYLPHQVRVLFNSAGQQVATVDALGRQTTFTYDGTGRLGTISLKPQSAGFAYLFSYPSATQLVVYAPGRTMSFALNAGRITSATDPDGSTVSFGYDPTVTNRIASRTDRRGPLPRRFGFAPGSKLAWDSLVNVAQTIVTRFTPAEIQGFSSPADTANAYTLLDGPRGDVYDYTRLWIDRFGAPRRIVDAMGAETQLSRGDARWPAAVTRVRYANGQVIGAAYDARGNAVEVTDSSTYRDEPGGRRYATTRYVWNVACDMDSLVTFPEGEIARMSYDGSCRRLWQEDGRGIASRVSFRYGGTFGQLSSVTPASLGAPRDSFRYDAARGNLSAQLVVDGGNQGTYLATTITTDGLGYAARVESPDGVVDSTYRDANRGLDTLTVRLGPQRTYDMRQLYTSPTWYSASQRVRLVYDLEGNLTETHRWSSAGGLHNTLVERTRYDWANRPVARVAPDGARDSTAYDAAGNPTALVTRRGDTLTMRYDAANRLLERRSPAVSYGAGSHDGASFEALTIGADTARFSYDLMGRDTLAMNRYARITRSYLTNGRLASETQRLRNVSDLSRTVSDPAGFGTHVYTLTQSYDLSGRRTQLGHPAQLGIRSDRTAFTYHAFGPLATITDPSDSTFRFTYDGEGRLDSLLYPNNTWEWWRYAYDGRLRYRYVLSGNRSGCPQSLGSESCFPDNVIRADTMYYTRDGLIALVQSAGRERFEYGYTGLGQVWYAERGYYSTRGHPGTYRYTTVDRFDPDALGNQGYHLTRSPVGDLYGDLMETFAYDATTGRLTRDSTYRASTEDRWTGTSTYDASGNTLYSSRGRTGSLCLQGDALVCAESAPLVYRDVARYYYDAEQRLRQSVRVPSFTNPNRDQVGGRERSYYDPYGRRVFREWLGGLYYDLIQGRADWFFERYVWDGAQILYEIRAAAWVAGQADLDTQTGDENGRLWYVHGPGIDRPLKVERADSLSPPLYATLYLHADWRGAITLGSLGDGSQDRTTSQSSEAMVDWGSRNQLTFGQQRSVYRTTNLRWFGSMLSQQVDGSKLQYLRNRYYDPQTGRFTQEDPIGLAGGLNLYGFAGGDPVNFSDPFGLNPCLRSPGACAQALVAGVQTVGRGSAAIGRGLAAAARWVGEGWTRLGQNLAARAGSQAPEVSAALANKLNHIFGKESHGLTGLVDELGSQLSAYRAIESATTAAQRAGALSADAEGLFTTTVRVGSTMVTVMGRVIEGVARIGTANSAQ